MSPRRLIVAILSALSAGFGLSAQETEPADSLVRLMSAKSVVVTNREEANVRYVYGPASFLHNNTYLICDTAIWNVDGRIINAFGHVRILQEETSISSEKLDYLIDENLAQFRGPVVELLDKDRNTLRTRNLDYNTKDSVAVFRSGASLKDSKGQVIESLDGTYDSKTKLFTFTDNVNMFTDSVFIRTDELLYYGNDNVAVFDSEVDIDKDDYRVYACRGRYDKGNEQFFLFDSVHALSAAQEVWSDTLQYDRIQGRLDLVGNVQAVDTTRGMTALGRMLHYEDSLRTMVLKRDAAVIMEMRDSSGAVSKVLAGADSIVCIPVHKCDVPETELSESAGRLADMDVDPVTEFRKKAAEAAAAKAEEARKEQDQKLGKLLPPTSGPQASPRPGTEPAPEPEPEPVPDIPQVPDSSAAADSLAIPDSLAVPDSLGMSDSLAVADSLAAVEPKDTTDIYFLYAKGDVKVHRSDMQMLCDSLAFTTLDSIIRLFDSPKIWNEGTRQYSARTINIRTDDQRLRKVSLSEDAFVIIQEDTACFDQIRSTEMMAYFDSTSALARFDALGGASAVFYLEENDALATVNRVDTKMLSANFKEGQIESVFYFEGPESDAFPTVQLTPADKKMTGFDWTPELCPHGLSDITPLYPRESEREYYMQRPRAVFTFTDKFFPGYIAGVHQQMEDNRRAREEARHKESGDPGSGVAVEDSLSGEALTSDDKDVVDPAPAMPDSTVLDTASVDDSTAAAGPVEPALSPLQARRLKAQQEREARWEKKDLQDALKQARKDAKKLERQRKAKLKLYKRQLEEDTLNERYLQRYKARFEKRKASATDLPQKESPDAESPGLPLPDSQERRIPSSREN